MNRLVLASVVALAACGGGSAGPDAAPPPITVQVADGTLLGKDLGDGTLAFLGVPYAAPPVGANRWRVPQPVVPWTDVRDARMAGSQCPQTLSFTGPGGLEDCLYLNVWVPPNVPATGLPVFLWIHGGAFVFGSGGDSYYDGHKLALGEDVIVVTINYRLGALGFMAHTALDHEDPTYPSSGNYGIEDQFAAIRWVHDNIAAFGGDPTHVLLAGESAGGYSTCIHYASARTAGMFAATISESGVCGAFANPHADAAANGATLATKLGCTQPAEADLLACLRAVDSQTILDATTTPIESQTPGGPLFDPTAPLFWPNDDGLAYTGTLAAALATPPAPARPLLLGTNHDEGTLFVSSIFAKPVTDQTELDAALAVRFTQDDVAAIDAQYPLASYASANDALAAATTDALFVCPARRTARAVATAGAPVFRYTFQKALENPLLPSAGVTHSAEIPFVFGNSYILGSVGTSGAALSLSMQHYWTQFGATGDPNGHGEPAWPAYVPASDPYTVLDAPISTAAGLESDVCDFWDTLAISL